MSNSEEKGDDWRACVGAKRSADETIDLTRAGQPGRGREAETPEQIPALGWRDIAWRILWSISADRILSTSGSVAFFALLAIFPGIAAVVSLYGLFADASTMGNHLSLLSGFLPVGVIKLIADQVSLIATQGEKTLGVAFVISLLIALGSANSGMAALFDALNVVYDEDEKRSLVRFYATTFMFTLVGMAFTIRRAPLQRWQPLLPQRRQQRRSADQRSAFFALRRASRHPCLIRLRARHHSSPHLVSLECAAATAKTSLAVRTACISIFVHRGVSTRCPTAIDP